MTKVRILGHNARLARTLEALFGLAVVEIVERGLEAGPRLPPVPHALAGTHPADALRTLASRLGAALALARIHARGPDDGGAVSAEPQADAGDAAMPPPPGEAELPALTALLDDLEPRAAALVRALDALRAEEAALPRHIRSTRRLLPLVPELLALEGWETVALLVEARAAGVLDLLRTEVEAAVGPRFEIASARIDPDTIGALLVFPREAGRVIHALLGRSRVSEVRLPSAYERLSLDEAIAAMEARRAAIPGEVGAARAALRDLLGPLRPRLEAGRALTARLLALVEAARQAGTTGHAFVLSGWAPRPALPALESELARAVGPEVALEEVSVGPEEAARAPVVLSNPPLVRPFEQLVALLGLPRPGALDPTPLMAAFLPLFMGIMIGDIAHGLVIGAGALLLRARLGARSPVARDLSSVLLFGSVWAVAFGFAYGELMGDLGRRFGLRPLWIDREHALAPLLAFSVAVGFAHVALGALIGVVLARRGGDRHLLLERGGALAAITGLFLLAAAAAGRLPHAFMTPGVAAVIVGLAALVGAGGAIGALTGPLEVLGLAGNVLSYLRLAAIGLASVYLSRVANELGHAVGPAWVGLLVAALFHALNVALAAFSPTIQALRLHYVEQFSRFHEGGGRAFAPFGAVDPSAGAGASPAPQQR